MKTSTIRELKHDTTRVLRWAEEGEAVEVTRRGRAVAVITPVARKKRGVVRPDFAGRLEEVYGAKNLAVTSSEVVSDARGER